MSQSIEQKLTNLNGVRKQIKKHATITADNDMNYLLFRTEQEIDSLLNAIEELRHLSNRLAHAVAILTDEKTSPLWVSETYRTWEQQNRKHYFPEV